MAHNPEKQTAQNYQSLDNPKIGDYWNEMFCPYFLVVDVKDKDITVLSCLGGPNSFSRKDEPCAKIDNKDGTWSFDMTKTMVVDREWMAKAVKYGSIEGFCADVSNSEKTVTIAMEWRNWRQKELRKQIQDLEAKWEEFTGWKYLKEEV